MTASEIEQLRRVKEKGFATLADLQRETNDRLDQTNTRLDEAVEQLGRIEGRFDHFLGNAGAESRAIREAVDDLQRRVRRLEDA